MVRRAIAYVPQNIELFSKTIYDNIRISRMDATMEEVKEAAKKADAHEFIRHLPLPKVQERVKSAIENMTGLEVSIVNVRIATVDMGNNK